MLLLKLLLLRLTPLELVGGDTRGSQEINYFQNVSLTVHGNLNFPNGDFVITSQHFQLMNKEIVENFMKELSRVSPPKFES